MTASDTAAHLPPLLRGFADAVGEGDAELRETHASWVVLAGDRAWKVKKPLAFAFLDQRTPERRRAACEAELELNRPLAPDIYLAVRGLAWEGEGEAEDRAAGGARDGAAAGGALDGAAADDEAGDGGPVGGAGAAAGGAAAAGAARGVRLTEPDDPAAVEYAVEMRRFDERETLAGLIARDALEPRHLRAVAERLAGFHAQAPLAPPDDAPHEPAAAAAAQLERLNRNGEELIALLAASDERTAVLAQLRGTAAYAVAHADLLAARARDGHVRELHGDLRAEHVLPGSPPAAGEPADGAAGMAPTAEAAGAAPVDRAAWTAPSAEAAGVAPADGPAGMARTAEAAGAAPADGPAGMARTAEAAGAAPADRVAGMPGRPTAATAVRLVDRLEFNRAWREVDTADELAFLAMDLTALGRPCAAAELLAAYRAAGGDAGDDRLVAFHAVYRAHVRAKVALLRAAQEEDDGARDDAVRERRRAERLLAVAERFAWRLRLPPVLVVCGPSASGKSVLAAEIGRRAGLAPLSSDVVRKRLAGVAPTERAGEEVYGEAMNARTYEALGRAAAGAAAAGGALVDATFRRRADRDAFARGLAGGAAAPADGVADRAAADPHAADPRAADAPSAGHAVPAAAFVELTAAPEVLRARAERRLTDARRVSDGTPELAVRQLAAFEPLSEVAPERHHLLRADRRPRRLADALAAALDAASP